MQMTDGKVKIPTSTFAAHGNLVPQGSQNASLLISSNTTCLKTMLSVFRKHASLRLATARSISERMNLFQNTGTWSYNVGGTRFPLRPVRANTEAFAELLKSFHSFSDVAGSGLHTLAFWIGTCIANNGVPSYILAQDFDVTRTYPGLPNPDSTCPTCRFTSSALSRQPQPKRTRSPLSFTWTMRSSST